MKHLINLDHRINACSKEIDNRNRYNFVFFAKESVYLTGVIFIFTLLIPFYSTLRLTQAAIFLYSIILFIYSRHCEQKKDINIRLALYLGFAPLLIGAVLVGTVFDPNKQAITFMLALTIIPPFIIDKPWRMILYQTIFVLFFIIMGYYFKPLNIFQEDMLYLPIYFTFSLASNLFSLGEKVKSAEVFTKAEYASKYDALTGMYNRKTGVDSVKSLIRSQVYGTFAMIDIDNFKHFNDEYGHQVGDKVLQEVAKCMQSVFRTSDVVFRLGGDEFSVYAINMLHNNTCSKRFELLLEKVKNIKIEGYESLKISFSIGCKICNNKNITFESMYKDSDKALYKAKNLGKGRVVIY